MAPLLLNPSPPAPRPPGAGVGEGPSAPASPPLLTPLPGFFLKNFCGGEQKRPGNPRLVSGRCDSQPGGRGGCFSRAPSCHQRPPPSTGRSGPRLSWRLGWRLEHRGDPGKASRKGGLHLARGLLEGRPADTVVQVRAGCPQPRGGSYRKFTFAHSGGREGDGPSRICFLAFCSGSRKRSKQ